MSVDERVRPHDAGIASDWPLFRLRLATDRLELRPPTDDEIAELARVARRGIHGDDVMPFANGWTDYPERVGRRFASTYGPGAGWRIEPGRCRSPSSSTASRFGVEQMKGEAFPKLRTVGTGSWLARAHQRRGIGSEMRAAVLDFTFTALERRGRRHRRLRLQRGLDRRLAETRIRPERHAARHRPRRCGRRVALSTLARAVACDREPRRHDRGLRACAGFFGVDEPN